MDLVEEVNDELLKFVNPVYIILSAGCFVVMTTTISGYLIRMHLKHYYRPTIQSKIIGIIYMAPIYAVDSLLGLIYPDLAIYINMLRDCYEAYVLYLFLSLMLSYLNCEEDDYEIVTYLETKKKEETAKLLCCQPPHNEKMSQGKRFLRYCKLGTLQYCVVRPSTAIIAMILSPSGLYEESNLSLKNANVYILLVLNISISFAFYALVQFYHALKEKLAPHQPLGKFLCIKFVIFIAFWQSVVFVGMVKLGMIKKIGKYGPEVISTGLQDYLICFEMMLMSMAMLSTFSYRPFIEESELEFDSTTHHQQLLTYNHLLADDLEMRSSQRTASSSRTSSTDASALSNVQPYVNKSKKLRVQQLTSAMASNSSSSKRLMPVNMSANNRNSKSRATTSEFTENIDESDELLEQITNSSRESSRESGGVNGIHRNDWQEKAMKEKARIIEHELYHKHSRPVTGHSKASAAHPRPSTAQYRDHALYQNTSNNLQDFRQVLNKHFAADAAVRDFNEAMPVLVLPTAFTASRGKVISSDPAQRLRALARQAEAGSSDDNSDSEDDNEV